MTSRSSADRRIMVVGASGLLGHFIACDLARSDMATVAVARGLNQAQRFGLRGSATVEIDVAALDVAALARLIDTYGANVVVNCVGVLQDGPGASTREVHEAFVDRLVGAIRSLERAILLIHIGVPGREEGEGTAFSLTKRRGEQLIRESGVPFAILRPGFVLAPGAYGGSALLRALAALPIDLPARERTRPFGTVAAEDLSETIRFLLRNWSSENRAHRVSFDLVHPEPSTLGQIVDLLRQWLGASAAPMLTLPAFLLDLGAAAGDLVARLGWSPPVRSTALAELRRGVVGDCGPWLAATGIRPRSLAAVLMDRPASIQERWFARLYLLKPVIIVTLTIFWCVSGLIALTVAYDAAVAILTARGFPLALARAVTIASSLLDISVGVAIAVRRTAKAGLLAGILVSACYLIGAALVTPGLWLEPLGALVKTGPAIVLMAVAIAILDKR